MSISPTKEHKEEDLLTVKEVAALLRVAKKTVYRYIEADQLSSVRFGGAVRVTYGAFKAFITGMPFKEQAPSVTANETSIHGGTLAYQVGEAAAMLHVTPEDIMEEVANGRLYMMTVGNAQVIRASELEQIIEAPAKVNGFTRQLLLEIGLIDERFPFGDFELYQRNGLEIKAITGYVAGRVKELSTSYNLGLNTGLDEILQYVGTEVIAGKYASQKAELGREKK